MCSETVTWGFGKDELDIHFDTEEEAKEYADEHSNEFYLYSYIEMDVDKGINYKDLKIKAREESAERKLYLKPCPFCGEKPTRNGTLANCVNCNITLMDSVWNARKHIW